jgi:hypothetical protein
MMQGAPVCPYEETENNEEKDKRNKTKAAIEPGIAVNVMV